MRIALYAIPPKVDREKLALLRRQLIHKRGGGHAVQYPIHCTLVRGVEVKDPELLLVELRSLAKELKSADLQATTSLVAGEYWAGVGLRSNAPFERLRTKLRELVEKHASEPLPPASPPHISLAYGRGILGVSKIISPIKHLDVDTISVAAEDEAGVYRVVAEIRLEH